MDLGKTGASHTCCSSRCCCPKSAAPVVAVATTKKAYWRLSLGLRWKKASSGSLFFPAAPFCERPRASFSFRSTLRLRSPPTCLASSTSPLGRRGAIQCMQPSLPAKDAAQLCLTRPGLHRHKSTSTKKTIIIFFTSKLFGKKLFTHDLTHTFYFVIEPKAVCKSTLLSLTPSYRGEGTPRSHSGCLRFPPPSHFLFPPCDASSDFDSDFPINTARRFCYVCAQNFHMFMCRGLGKRINFVRRMHA